MNQLKLRPFLWRPTMKRQTNVRQIEGKTESTRGYKQFHVFNIYFFKNQNWRKKSIFCLQVQEQEDLHQIYIKYLFEMLEERRPNLFTVLENGDKRIDKLKDTATILVGGTRIGKSTLFNLLLAKLLMGKGKGLNTWYDLQSQDGDIALISTAFKSETLVPNIKYDFTQLESLIDMAGFGDTRDYIGVIGVSYFLHRIFEKVKKARFLLVINEFGMADPTGAKLIETFNGFIKMFRFDLMTPQIKTKLMNSLSLVVTKSKHADYHPYLENVIEQLQDLSFQAENRDLIIELVQSLIDSNRIEGFKASKENVAPKDEERKFLERFSNTLNWKYFDLREAENSIGQSIISLPFGKDFDELKEDDRFKFNSDLKDKIESYSNISKIISSFLNNFINNWNQVIERWEITRELIPTYFKMEEAFITVKEFLDKYDVYNSDKTVDIKFRPSYDAPTLVATISSIVKAYEIAERMSIDDIEKFEEKMSIVADVYQQILNIFTPFCSNEEDEKLLARLIYVIKRGLIECSTLFELKGDLVTEVVFRLKDSIENAFELKLKKFYESFFEKINADLMPEILTTPENLDEYQKLIQDYDIKFKAEQEDILLIPLQKCSIGSAKSELLLRCGQKMKAYRSLDKVLRTYMEIIDSLNNFVEGISPIADPQAKIKDLFMRKRRVILKIVSILKQMNRTETFEPLPSAIALCKEQNLASQAFEIYQLIIGSEKMSLSDKNQACIDYHNFLIQWGMLEKAREVLIRKQSIQTEDYQSYEDSMNMIANFEDKREQYAQNFRSRSKILVQQSGSNDNLFQILDNISNNLPQDKEEKEGIKEKAGP